MTKRYEKIGQANIYREKKKNGCGPIIGVILLFFVAMALLSECSGAELTGKPLDLILNDPIPANANKGVSNPSRLSKVSGEPRLLMYEKRSGNISPFQFAVETSKQADRLVILAASTEKYKTQAVDHAQKLAKWLELELNTVERVQIIVYQNDKGVGYYYYVSGLTHWDNEGPVLAMKPDQATAELEKVVWTHKARLALIERGEHLDILN
ncbi:MAG: hypothetical protein AAF065_13200 [Verrucomicrobiota bacterium]